jgi:hypothetical protein
MRLEIGICCTPVLKELLLVLDYYQQAAGTEVAITGKIIRFCCVPSSYIDLSNRHQNAA